MNNQLKYPSLFICFTLLLSCNTLRQSFDSQQREDPSIETSVVNGFPAMGADPREAGIVRIATVVGVSFPSGKPAIDPNCPGTLINNRWVLTAAHCLRVKHPVTGLEFESQDFIVVKGLAPLPDDVAEIESNPIFQMAKVRRIYFHPKIDGLSYAEFQRELKYLPDVALIELQTPLQVNGTPQDFRQKIYAAGMSDLPGKTARVYGYSPVDVNADSDEILRFADLSIGNLIPDRNRYEILKNDLGQHTFSGDSGGPNFIGNELIGVNSNGNALKIFSTIIWLNFYATAAPYFRDWVMETVNTEFESRPSTMMAFSAKDVNLAGYPLASFSTPSQALPINFSAIRVRFNSLRTFLAKAVRVEHDRMIDSQRRDIYQVRADDLSVDLDGCPLLNGSATTRRCSLEISVVENVTTEARRLTISNLVFKMRNSGALGLRMVGALSR